MASRDGFKLGFGSCNKPWQDMSLWEDVADEAPDAFAWLGDAVYADIRTKTRDGHRGREYRGEAFHEAAFHQVKEYEPYARLRATSDVIGTWDDHDYGYNNVGKDWAHKDFAKRAFLDFLDEPIDSERRTRDGGVYDAVDYVNPDGRRVRVVLLDLRWDMEEGDDAREGTLMSEAQWSWLRDVLSSEPRADLTAIGSSIQVLEAGYLMLQGIARFSEPARMVAEGLESWTRTPSQQRRLMDTITASNASVVFMSGDVHHGQIAVEPPGCFLPYKTMDATASGFTHTPFREAPEPLATFFKYANPLYYRSWILPAYDRFTDINYGELNVNWKTDVVELSIKTTGRRTMLKESARLAELTRDPSLSEEDYDLTHCHPVLSMSFERRRTRVLLFFAWCLCIYVSYIVVPLASAYALGASIRRKAKKD